jgi:hypothetical protein
MRTICKATGLIALALAVGASGTASAAAKATHTNSATPQSASLSTKSGGPRTLPFGTIDRFAPRATRAKQEAFTYGKSLAMRGLGSSDPNWWAPYVSSGLRTYAAGGFQAGQAVRAGN